MKLQQQEIAKTRRLFAYAWSVLSGFASAYFTFGGTLVISLLSGRKWRVADRKLELIREELARRKVPLHKLDWKDVAIPLGSAAVGTALGAGIDVGLGSLVNISDVATGSGGGLQPTGAHHGEGIREMIAHPEQAAQGFGEGFESQPERAFHGGQSVAQMLGISPADVPAQAIEINQTGVKDLVAELEGVHLGTEAALALEKTAGNLIATQLCWWITELFEDPDWYREAAKTLGCTRFVGAHNMSCDHCKRKITEGTYMHCCKCNEDDFDLCMDCYDDGERCPHTKDGLHSLQFAWIGNLCHPRRWEACERFEKYTNLVCDGCKEEIFQGRYFQCLECNKSGGGYDLCANCFQDGKKCTDSENHALYSFMWAHAPDKDEHHPYEDRGSGTAKCDRCTKEVNQGVFYHCDDCKDGEFDLCHRCYETGGGCGFNDHMLSRYNAFLDAVEGVIPPEDFCDVPDCHKKVEKEGLYYSCLRCNPYKNRPGIYVVCHSCYGSGAGCFDSEHSFSLRYADESSEKEEGKFSFSFKSKKKKKNKNK